ncbi:MAG: hypothetical protein KF716_21800 [Anaerolineae bacterium]|nr:hypothetical protein [Anaerolineae bacterium]
MLKKLVKETWIRRHAARRGLMVVKKLVRQTIPDNELTSSTYEVPSGLKHKHERERAYRIPASLPETP